MASNASKIFLRSPLLYARNYFPFSCVTFWFYWLWRLAFAGGIKRLENSRRQHEGQQAAEVERSALSIYRMFLLLSLLLRPRRNKRDTTTFGVFTFPRHNYTIIRITFGAFPLVLFSATLTSCVFLTIIYIYALTQSSLCVFRLDSIRCDSFFRSSSINSMVIIHIKQAISMKRECTKASNLAVATQRRDEKKARARTHKWKQTMATTSHSLTHTHTLTQLLCTYI